MNETLKDLIYQEYFPLITGLGKSGLALLTQEQGNMDMLGYYLIGSALWDAGELWFNQNPKTYSYFLEKRLYRGLSLLVDDIKDFPSGTCKNIRDTMGALWDGFMGR